MNLDLIFDPSLWQPFVSASTWAFLARGLAVTAQLAVAVMLIALPLGAVAATARISPYRWVRLPIEGLVGLLRSLPVLVILFSVFFLAPALGVHLEPFPAALVALSLYFAAILSDVMRAGLRSLERGQWEAAAALGLSPRQRMLLVIGPQALRRMVPAIVSVCVTCIKDTSLASIITVSELMNRSQQLQAFYANPLQTYIVVGLVYLLINLILSRAASRLERRRGGRAGREPTHAGEPPRAKTAAAQRLTAEPTPTGGAP